MGGMMGFTKEQMETLSKYEKNIRRAYESDWVRGMMQSEIDEIYGIYVKATGISLTMRRGCSYCLLALLKEVGRIYFRQKVEMGETSEAKGKKKVSTRKKGREES